VNIENKHYWQSNVNLQTPTKYQECFEKEEGDGGKSEKEGQNSRSTVAAKGREMKEIN